MEKFTYCHFTHIIIQKMTDVNRKIEIKDKKMSKTAQIRKNKEK